MKITIDLSECPHIETLKHWASVSRTFDNALHCLEEMTTNDDHIGQLSFIAIDELIMLRPALDWLHKTVRDQLWQLP